MEGDGMRPVAARQDWGDAPRRRGGETEDGGGMPWTRLDGAVVARALRAAWDDPYPEAEALAEQALAHLREELLSGRFIAVQDHLGHTFIGTPSEAAEHMMAASDG
jgi:hypothetical protein